MSEQEQQVSAQDALLKRIEKQEADARHYGFFWQNVNQIISQIHSECKEVQEAWNKNDKESLQDEVGDLMQASVSLAIFCGLDPQETLSKSVDKFQARYEKVQRLAKDDGYDNLQQQPFEVLISYWNKAKAQYNGD